MSHRRLRVADRIRTGLASLLMREVSAPALGFVTVTEVRMSTDLRYARVFVSVMGDAEAERTSLEALERAAGFLRRAIGQRIRLRHVPELRFVPDKTLDESDRIEELLLANPVPDPEDDRESD